MNHIKKFEGFLSTPSKKDKSAYKKEKGKFYKRNDKGKWEEVKNIKENTQGNAATMSPNSSTPASSGKVKKYKVIFDGFDTKEQAIEFANWYEGQGEQDSGVWMEEHTDLSAVNVDITAYHQQGGFNMNQNSEVIVPLELFYK